MGLQLARDGDDPSFKLSFFVHYRSKFFKNNSFSEKITFKLVTQINNLGKE